jgi:hypothetical protein
VVKLDPPKLISFLKPVVVSAALGSLAASVLVADWPAENGAILANGERPLSISG